MGKTYAHQKPRTKRDISPAVADGRRDAAARAARTVASRQRQHWMDRWEADKEDREAAAVIALAYTAPQSAVQTDPAPVEAIACGYCGSTDGYEAPADGEWPCCLTCGGV